MYTPIYLSVEAAVGEEPNIVSLDLNLTLNKYHLID